MDDALNLHIRFWDKTRKFPIITLRIYGHMQSKCYFNPFREANFTSGKAPVSFLSIKLQCQAKIVLLKRSFHNNPFLLSNKVEVGRVFHEGCVGLMRGLKTWKQDQKKLFSQKKRCWLIFFRLLYNRDQIYCRWKIQ